MASLLKLPEVWRILREIDLEQIRRDAEARFRLVILAEERSRASALAAALAGEPGHPWLDVRDVEAPLPEPSTATAALLLTSQADLPEPLALAAQALRQAGVPTVTVVHGSTRTTDAVVRAGETARAAVASLDGGIDAIAEALVDVASPAMRLALARQLPPMRPAVFSALVEETARANATYAFSAGMAETVPVLNVPLNVADTLVLTKNQLLMGYKIALGAGKSGRPRDLVGEVIGVIGGGMLFRQAARSLVGLIPVAGLLPKVVIAYAGTWAIGRAVGIWANEGRRVSSGTVRQFSREARAQGRSFARGLIGRRS